MAPIYKKGAARVWANEFRITRVADNVEIKRGADTYDVTVMEDNDHKYIPGLRFADISCAGIADAQPSTSYGTHQTWQQGLQTLLGSTSAQIWTAAMMGDAVSAGAYLFQTNQTQVSFNSPAAGRIGVNAGAQPSSKPNLGMMHMPGTSTLTSTGAQAAVDGTAATAVGGVVHYHLTDVTTSAGSTVATFKIVMQHSSLAVSWADITGTSSTFAGAGQAWKGSKRKLTVNQAIKRYTRANVSVFTGGVNRKVQAAVAFARTTQ